MRTPSARMVRITHPAMGLALLFRATCAYAELPSPAHRIELSAPRDFGYVMGEPIRHNIDVQVAQAFELEADFLPQPGSAVSDWLELRQAEWKREDRGGETAYHITLSYQVFKGVRDPEILTVPALPLRFRDGDSRIEVEAPAWNFTLTPLIPPKTPDENVALRGDLPPPTYPTGPHQAALAGFLIGITALLLYASWHLGLPPFRAINLSPFARAERTLRKLGRRSPSIEDYREALRLVHGAINETAGHTVLAGRLDRFLVEHPEFEGLREQLTAFFQVSQRVFFVSSEPQTPSDYSLDRLKQLCQQCRSIERERR